MLIELQNSFFEDEIFESLVQLVKSLMIRSDVHQK